MEEERERGREYKLACGATQPFNVETAIMDTEPYIILDYVGLHT